MLSSEIYLSMRMTYSISFALLSEVMEIDLFIHDVIRNKTKQNYTKTKQKKNKNKNKKKKLVHPHYYQR